MSGGAARGVVDALAEHVFNDELRKYGERKEKAPRVFQGSLYYPLSRNQTTQILL